MYGKARFMLRACDFFCHSAGSYSSARFNNFVIPSEARDLLSLAPSTTCEEHENSRSLASNQRKHRVMGPQDICHAERSAPALGRAQRSTPIVPMNLPCNRDPSLRGPERPLRSG
jgi:hypothetical protein